MKRLSFVIQTWLVSFVACAAVAALSFARADVPVARYFWQFGRFLNPLSGGFGTTVILSMESAVILVLVCARLLHGRISRLGEILAMACVTSICAYGINDHVLKLLCGVPNPVEVMQGARHAFNLLKGCESSSFPSGHMVLAAAFAGVFMRHYKAAVWPLSALLALAAGLLIIGDWHFISDIVAGTFVGISAGFLAGEAWAVHSNLRR